MINSVFNAKYLFIEPALILFERYYIKLIRFLRFLFFQISLIKLKILGFIICALSADLIICCHNFKRKYRFDFEILVFASQVKSSILLSICLLCLNELFGFAKVFRLKILYRPLSLFHSVVINFLSPSIFLKNLFLQLKYHFLFLTTLSISKIFLLTALFLHFLNLTSTSLYLSEVFASLQS